MKSERSILTVEQSAETKAKVEEMKNRPLFTISFREALELLFEVGLPMCVDGINFMKRTYTDKDGVVYNIGDLSADNAISYDELEQRLDEVEAIVVKYLAYVCAWGINFGINIGVLATQLQAIETQLRNDKGHSPFLS